METGKKSGGREVMEMEGSERAGIKEKEKHQGRAGRMLRMSHEPKIMAKPRLCTQGPKIKENLFQRVRGILDFLQWKGSQKSLIEVHHLMWWEKWHKDTWEIWMKCTDVQYPRSHRHLHPNPFTVTSAKKRQQQWGKIRTFTPRATMSFSPYNIPPRKALLPCLYTLETWSPGMLNSSSRGSQLASGRAKLQPTLVAPKPMLFDAMPKSTS